MTQRQRESLLRVCNGLAALDGIDDPQQCVSIVSAYMQGLNGTDAYYDLATLFGIALSVIDDVQGFIDEAVQL